MAEGDRQHERLTPQRFAELYQDAARTLWAIAAAVHGDRDRADDTLQEAIVIAIQKLDQFEPGSNFTRWMGQIVRFVALNQRRRTHRRATQPVDPLALDRSNIDNHREHLSPATTAVGDLHPDQVDFDDQLTEALQSLDEKTRCCLLLRTVLDMPYREVARVLDIPEGTAMSCVHRGRAALRQMLEHQDSTLDPTVAGRNDTRGQTT